jgi:PKD repeat protein
MELSYQFNDGSERFNAKLNMIKYFFVFTILFFPLYHVNSQISVPGKPESFFMMTKKAAVIPRIVLNAIDTSKLWAEDRRAEIPNRYGIVQQTEIDIKTEGVKTNIEGKGTIWQYEVNSPFAYSLGVTFGKFNLPEGSSVFFYNEARTQILGAFTSLNNNSLHQLTIAEFSSQNVIIEYFEPLNPTFSGQLVIASVSQAYKNLQKAATSRIGINCTDGENWQDVKHAVCLMTFNDTRYSYFCTGFLVNNVKEDGTPYFQTANHCINSNNEATTLVTYFNYENSTCTSSDATLVQTLSGAILKATNSYSDFTLLLLNEYPPSSYFPFYAGWDASSRSPQKGICIHHPSGTAKCIALDDQAPTTHKSIIQWTDNSNVVTSTSGANTHWEVQFNIGSTEEGSSGSPLLDDNQRVIGQLHGGSSVSDYYGKFSLSWNHSSSSSSQLKSWLDPDNSGTMFTNGFYGSSKPKALFSTILTRICPGSSITFTDKSKFNPTSWTWNIQPSSYKFANGTSKNSRNPEIIFDTIGNYTVSLTVLNTHGADSLTKTDYISAGDIQVKLSGIPGDSIICGYNLSNYPVGASGATDYKFSLERSDKINYSIASDSIYLSLISAEKKNGSFNSWLKVTGTQGACISKDSIEMKISVPVNDDVENAIRLVPGRNSTYSNFCACAEPNEASPSSVPSKNTIWFTFLGPSNGIVNIDTHGFNDLIAVYDAGSYLDLLSGSKTSYNLLASNDNRSATDNTAIIKNLSVDPYRIYWLQVDGSAGSAGNCVIDLLSNSLEVFPNPSSGEFNVIISNNEDANADIKIVSLSGKVLYQNKVSVTKENNRFAFNLSLYPAGIYYVVVNINGSNMKANLLLVK